MICFASAFLSYNTIVIGTVKCTHTMPAICFSLLKTKMKLMSCAKALAVAHSRRFPKSTGRFQKNLKGQKRWWSTVQALKVSIICGSVHRSQIRNAQYLLLSSVLVTHTNSHTYYVYSSAATHQ